MTQPVDGFSYKVVTFVRTKQVHLAKMLPGLVLGLQLCNKKIDHSKWFWSYQSGESSNLLVAASP